MTQVCGVCKLLTSAEVAELNAILADPAQWPKNILAEWNIPKGVLPGKMRSWGAVATCQDWLAQHGYPAVSRRVVEGHINRHVVHVVRSDEEMVQLGRMVKPDAEPTLALMPTARANLFVDYYALGIQMSLYALEKMKRDLAEAEAAGEKVDKRTLWQLIDLGAKLSMSQASMLSRGTKVEDQGDSMAGFRAGDAPLPSQKFGDHRIRTIEGVTRPVTDRGPADRREYNERAEQEGSPKFDA